MEDMLLSFILILAAVGTLEWVLVGLWCRPYYSRGLVVYKAVLRDCVLPLDSIDLEALEGAFKSFAFPSLICAWLSPNEIGFREKILDFAFLWPIPIMRGMSTADPDGRAVTSSGRAKMRILIG